MTYRGRVRNGVVVLDDPMALPEGAEVSVRALRPKAKEPGDSARRPAVGRALLRLAGQAKGLPRDASRNLDHCLYGHRKRGQGVVLHGLHGISSDESEKDR